MASEYNLYCPFDLDKHKQTYTNYLEVVITEDGTIMYAVPSHVKKVEALACARLHVSPRDLDDMCPPQYYFDYITYLCKAANAVAVWNDHCVAPNPTPKQIVALRRLKLAGVYKGSIPNRLKGE